MIFLQCLGVRPGGSRLVDRGWAGPGRKESYIDLADLLILGLVNQMLRKCSGKARHEMLYVFWK